MNTHSTPLENPPIFKPPKKDTDSPEPTPHAAQARPRTKERKLSKRTRSRRILQETVENQLFVNEPVTLKTWHRSPIFGLSAEQQCVICEWLLSGIPFSRAIQKIEQTFKITVTYKELAVFWDRRCSEFVRHRRSRAAAMAHDIDQQLHNKEVSCWTQPTIDALNQRAFELTLNPEAHVLNIRDLVSLGLKFQEQKIEEKKLSLQEQKMKRTDCATKAQDSTPARSPEQMQARFREIFGMENTAKKVQPSADMNTAPLSNQS